MDQTDTPLGRGAFRRFRRKIRPDYKQRLASKTTSAQDEHAPGASTPFPPVEQMRLLAERADVERTAFQSVAVAALQTLCRACYHERRAAETIISLAQRQKLHHLIDELEATSQALSRMLSPHGAVMFSLKRRKAP